MPRSSFKLTRQKNISPLTKLACLATCLVLVLHNLPAQDNAEEIALLREQVRLMQQQLEQMQRKIAELEKKQSASQALAKPATAPEKSPAPTQTAKAVAVESGTDQTKPKPPSFTFGERGLVVDMPEQKSQARLGVLMQLDGRLHLNDQADDGLAPPLTGEFNTLDMRRLRPTFRGTLFEKLEFRFTAELAGSPRMLDAYFDYLILGDDLKLRAGNMKTPPILELQQSGSHLLFNERAFPNEFTPSRDLGIMLHGENLDGALGWKLGIFHGAAHGTNGAPTLDTNDAFDLAGSLFAHPFKNSEISLLQGLGLGFAASWGEQTNANAAFRLRNMGRLDVVRDNTLIEDGESYRLNPSGYYFLGPFGLIGEYVLSSRVLATTRTPLAEREFRRYHNQAWNIQASWLLTGENAGFGGVKPRRPLDPSAGHWGAWQLAARYTALRVDGGMFHDGLLLLNEQNPHGNAQRADAWSLGLNWYPTSYTRAMLSFNQTLYSGLGGSRQTDNALLFRFQLDF